MNNIKAVFFDIDGTLVSFATHRVPQQTIDALAELRRRGIKVFIATGRMLPMLTVLDGIPFDGYVTYNGAFCADTDRRMIYANPLPKEDLLKLVELIGKEPFPVALMTEKEMTVNMVDRSVESLIDHIGVAMPRTQNPRETIKEEVYQMCIFLDEEGERRLVGDVLKGCESSRWIDYFADVNRIGNNKQSGIDKILEHYGIDLSETMAFGDGGNDISMLRHVALGVAMGNARDHIKAAADYVTDSVDDNGIPNALRHFNLID